MTTTKQGETNVLPVILIAAVAQGWALYGLHQAIKHLHWPATNTAWLVALYAVAIFVPLTVQFLAVHVRTRAHAILVAIIAIAFFYFGWHHGGAVLDLKVEELASQGEFFPIGFILGVLWLLLLPFVQARLSAGSWSVEYRTWFALAWRNKLTLAEAGLFTGLFWLLLLLWQELFHMLGIDFFKELFQEPLFIYPVTSLVFGLALHLIGSIERMTQLILEQILNVLKWLAILAGLILALFTLALAVQLPGMLASGQKAIGAAWLLWLVAVMVLLLNAAYRDGSVARPYPKWLALALRCVVPFMVVVALTAVYALLVRVRNYGLTVERVWALVVAGMALIYSLGYSLTAFSKGYWLHGMARINVGAAIVLIAVLAATLTPVLSPYRLAANSQFALAQEPVINNKMPPETYGRTERETPFHALRFDTGKYGKSKLAQLAAIQGIQDAQRVRDAAILATQCEHNWNCQPNTTPDAVISQLTLLPVGSALEPGLAEALRSEIKCCIDEFQNMALRDSLGVFIDLDGDNVAEFAFIAGHYGRLFARESNRWALVGKTQTDGYLDLGNLRRDAAANDIKAVSRKWKDLRIGRRSFQFDPVTN
jgi:hypothetical protein